MAFEIVTTPVAELTDSVPVKAPDAVADAPVIEPLSPGAADGVTVVPPPELKLVVE